MPTTLYSKYKYARHTYKYLAWQNLRSTDQRIYPNNIIMMRALYTLDYIAQNNGKQTQSHYYNLVMKCFTLDELHIHIYTCINYIYDYVPM